MKKLSSYLILILLLLGGKSFSADIVYPSSTTFTTTSPTSFFIGNETPNKKLQINSEPVKLHSTGGFYHPVELNTGENIFNITNSRETKTYKIIRENNKLQNKFEKFVKYKDPLIFDTVSDITPLRATPIEKGLNRLQTIGKDIKLKVVGEYNDFYKVQLSRDDFVWVAKNKLKKSNDEEFSLNELKGYHQEETTNKIIYKFQLTKKSPYIFTPITIYETDNELSFFKEKIKNYQLIIYNIKNQPENIFEIDIEAQKNPFGYNIYYSDNNVLTLEIKKAPIIDKSTPLKNIKIMIDPGHGGYESGAIGCLGNKEKDTNLEIALKLKNKLKKAGATVIMTRMTDKPLSLQERIILTNEYQADIFLSIHNNALPDELAFSNKSGTSTYYYNLQSNNLAEHIQKSLIETLKLNNDKVRRESFAVIRNPQTIAILIEVGYVIIPEDNAKLITKSFQEQAATAILKGLENYLNEFAK